MEEQKKSSNNKIVLGILLALLVGLGAYTLRSNSKHVEAENFLKEEKEQILGNLTTMEEKYDNAIAQNTTISEELKIERDKITAYKDSVINLKGTNWRLIRRYRGQIASLEATNERLLFVTDSLKLVNNLLVIEKDSITGKLIEQTSFNDTLIAQNLDLAKKVEIGGVMRVSAVNSTAMRLRSNGKYTETNKAQKTEAIRVNFKIEENEIATPGDKIVHVVINTPTGKIVNQKGTFNTKSGQEVGFTIEDTITYENAAKDVTLFIDKLTVKLDKGIYTTKVYVDGLLVGASNIELKDAFLGL
jgi:hypothetical protein